MTQFKHAAVLKMYAEDATKTQTPWDLLNRFGIGRNNIN